MSKGPSISIEQEKKQDTDDDNDSESLVFETKDLIQLKPEFEEHNAVDLKGEYDEKAFILFKKECQEDVHTKINEMNTRHIEFSGQVVKGKKEGKGSYLCKKTENFYYGSFNNDDKNGYGIMFFGKNNDI